MERYEEVFQQTIDCVVDLKCSLRMNEGAKPLFLILDLKLFRQFSVTKRKKGIFYFRGTKAKIWQNYFS